jgi:hypothetical protein
MPRSIIDTESSKGRLVRRRIVFAAVLLLVLLALLFGIWEALEHAGAARVQGNLAPRLKVGLREYAT